MSLSGSIKTNFPTAIELAKEVAQMLDYIENKDFEHFHADMQFYPVSPEAIKYYFNNSEVIDFFGLLGEKADGSIIAIWKDGESQKYIHLGSEGNNWMILANNPIDFIKVIAIGYTEFTKKGINNPPKDSTINKSFQEWVEKTFSLEIPESGKGIIDAENQYFEEWIKSKMKF